MHSASSRRRRASAAPLLAATEHVSKATGAALVLNNDNQKYSRGVCLQSTVLIVSCVPKEYSTQAAVAQVSKNRQAYVYCTRRVFAQSTSVLMPKAQCESARRRGWEGGGLGEIENCTVSPIGTSSHSRHLALVHVLQQCNCYGSKAESLIYKYSYLFTCSQFSIEWRFSKQTRLAKRSNYNKVLCM